MLPWNSDLKPNLLPMNGSDSNSFPLEARKNKGAILENMAPLFSEPRVRASREKIISNPTAFIGSKLGLNSLRDSASYYSDGAKRFNEEKPCELCRALDQEKRDTFQTLFSQIASDRGILEKEVTSLHYFKEISLRQFNFNEDVEEQERDVREICRISLLGLAFLKKDPLVKYLLGLPIKLSESVLSGQKDSSDIYLYHDIASINLAIKYGCLEDIKSLISKHQVNISEVDQSFFQEAIREGKNDIVSYLIQEGVFTNGSELETAITLINKYAEDGVIKLAAFKIAEKIKASNLDLGQCPSYLESASNKAPIWIEVLYDHLNPEQMSSLIFGNDLLKPISCSTKEVAEYILDTKIPRTQEQLNNTALEVFNFDYSDETERMLDLFLDKGADLNLKRVPSVDLVHVMNFLKFRGREFDWQSEENQKLIYRSLEAGSVELLKSAHETRVQFDWKDNGNFSLLYRAIENGHVEIIKAALETGADVNQMCHDIDIGINQKSLLYYAIDMYAKSHDEDDDERKEALEQTMDILLGYPNLQINTYSTEEGSWNYERSTALHLAVNNSLVDIVEKLREHGADPQLKTKMGDDGDQEGMDAFEIAKKQKKSHALLDALKESR